MLMFVLYLWLVASLALVVVGIALFTEDGPTERR